jgi:hypothetical protein
LEQPAGTGSVYTDPMFSETLRTLVSLKTPAKAAASDVESGQQAERLEIMKSEFQNAQQRRRTAVPVAPPCPDRTDEGPTVPDPAIDAAAGIAAVRP